MDMRYLRRLVKVIDASSVGSLLWIAYYRELMAMLREEIAKEEEPFCDACKQHKPCSCDRMIEDRDRPFDAPDPRD